MNQPSDAYLDLLKEHWGLSGSLARLPGENLNYRVDDGDTNTFVLKVTTEGHADLELEEALIQHLVHATMPVPSSMPAADGRHIVEADLEGHRASMRLQTFLQGTQWRSTQSSDELLANIGASLAKVHLALADFDHDAGKRTHSWDIAAAQQHRPAIEHLQNEQQRQAVEHCFPLSVWIAR